MIDTAAKDRSGEGAGFSRATFRSCHGLGLCLARDRAYEGLQDCRAATGMEPDNPAVWWNLSRAALMLGRRGEAYRALREGLSVRPDHEGIARDLWRMGLRRPPVLTFLARSHPLNVFLGRFRHARLRESRVGLSHRRERNCSVQEAAERTASVNGCRI